MKTLGIFGTSGFAREINDIATELGYKTVFIARDQAELDDWPFNYEAVLEQDIDRLKDMVFSIGIGDNVVRRKVADRFRSQASFINLVHPDATFGKGQREIIDAQIGLIVCAGVRFTNNIQIGEFSIFNLNATVGHDVIIDSFVNIAPGANISGNVHLGAGCWIGTGAAVNQGTSESKLSIGPGTVIGSGSVVVKNCEPGAVYVGIPAKRIK